MGNKMDVIGRVVTESLFDQSLVRRPSFDKSGGAPSRSDFHFVFVDAGKIEKFTIVLVQTETSKVPV